MTVTVPPSEVAARTTAHGQRNALRRLLAGLMDAWDTGDAYAFAAHFSPTGTWSDPSGHRSVGQADLRTHFSNWRAWEPWSLHWLSNEDAPSAAVGTWLWSAASTVDGGALGAWSGGDLTAELAMTPQGWRLERLEMSDRYRTPYGKGWLAVPHLEPRPSADSGAAPPGAYAAVPAQQPLVARNACLDELVAEIAVRHLMGDLVHGLETGQPGIEVARHWAPGGRYVLVDAEDKERSGEGPAGIAGLVEADRHETSTHLQVLMSESITVHGARATGRWRDLWAAERLGEARWMAHQYLVDTHCDDGTWRLERVMRRRLLDCSYVDGWIAGDEG